MKKIISLFILSIFFIQSQGNIYQNFLEASKYAYKDKDYPLAIFFLDTALATVPSDSIFDVYEIHSFRRDVSELNKKYVEAIIHGEETIAALKKMGEISPYFELSDRLDIANIYSLMTDSVKAYEIADDVFKRALQSNLNWDEKLNLSDKVGLIYIHTSNWKNAESAYELGYMIAKRMPKSEKTIRILNLYGNTLYHTNKYADALKVYQEQREACKELYGENSREYQWANYCIANIMAYMGDINGGRDIYQEVIAWYRNRIFNDLQTLPSMQRRLYLDNMIDILQNSIPFGIEAKYDEDEFTKLSYECLLQTKGLLLATEISSDAIIRNNGSPEEQEKLNQLKSLQKKLSNLRANNESDPKEILNTYAQIKGLDYQIAQIIAKYGNNSSFASISYEDIKNNMGDDDVILDFADFKPQSKPRQYVCYEIRKNQHYPKIHYVCNGAELDSLLSLENNVWSNLYDGESGEDMKRIVGQPLKNIIGNSKKVYYVPSGIFHKLAIEAIPFYKDKLGDKFSFNRLSSAREVLSVKAKDSLHSAQIYGGLKYGDGIKPLPQSLDEVKTISQTFDEVYKSTLLTENDGTYDSFITMSGDSPNIIHISTHGFYYDPNADLPASLQGYDDAMSLSGLIMSNGSIMKNEGLLTAEKVSSCNLINTSLACLASCDSGQGEVTSEGIYGLQRGFKKAGVGSIIVSLWKASDVVTKFFMTNFYDDLVNGSKDRHKAFDKAKIMTRKKYPSPYYWAGFAMID